MVDILQVSSKCWAIHLEVSENHLEIHIFGEFQEACDFALKHNATQQLFNNLIKQLNGGF
jgi:hypothetical protein